MNFSDAIVKMPEQGRQIIDQLFRFNITPPFILLSEEDEEERVVIGWSKKDYYLEFEWSANEGFQWFYRFSNPYEYGGSDGDLKNDNTELPEEARKVLKKVFSDDYLQSD